MKFRLYVFMIAFLAHNGHSFAAEIKFKRVEILESNGILTTLRIFKGRNLFLSSQGENSKCHNSGIEAALNSTISYTVRCQNSPKGDEGMKSRSFATYDGRAVKINARSELKKEIYFTHSWIIEIAGRSCTGGVHIESTFGSFDKSIVSCKVYY